jgi:2-keto-3-deoxy-L-rhamnonate aldolase RhmA
MEIRRLAWAGIEVCAGRESAVIDFVENREWMQGQVTLLHYVPIGERGLLIDTPATRWSLPFRGTAAVG